MSAVVKIDGAGNLPTFLDRAQAGLDRMVKSEHNVKGALRGLSEALDSTGNSAQMASQAANVLSEKFVRGLGGVAVVGAVKIVADQISNMAEIIGQVGEKAAKAIDQLQAMSDPSNFQEAVSQSASLKQTMGEINEEILKIEKNPLRNFISQITGAKEEMQKLSETMKRVSETNVAFGAMRGEKRALDTMGMTSEQVKQYDLSQKRNQQIEEASKLSPGLREQAVESLKKTFELEDQNARNQAENKSTMTGEQAAMALGTQFDNDRLDYQRKEADRIAKLQEDRAAQKEADQQAYYRKQGKEQSDYSARQDKQTALYSKTSAEYMDAYMAKNAVENKIAGESLSASREGQLILNAAQKRQANQNRIDNYKFQQEQVQKYVDKMQTRGSGQSAEQFERYSNMTPDQARKAAREDLAKQQAAETNPSMRDQAATTLADYLKNVDALLNQLTQYAHVT